MTVYLDVILLLNFCIDYLLLMLTGIFLKRELNRKRIALSALLASLYVLVIFYPYVSVLYHPIFKFLFSMVVILLAFRFQRFTYFMQNVAMFYFVTFMIGGGLIALRFFLQSDSQILNGMIVTKQSGLGDPFSWLFIIIGFPLVWLFSHHRISNINVRKLAYDQMANVEIHIGEDVYHLKGLIDSGNQLMDPITRDPVMILDMNYVNLPSEIVALVKQSDLGLRSGVISEHPWDVRLRLVPYRSVGQDHTFMLAIRPDFIQIIHDNQKYVTKRCLIGLSSQLLSSEGDYACIVHPKMLLQSTSPTAS